MRQQRIVLCYVCVLVLALIAACTPASTPAPTAISVTETQPPAASTSTPLPPPPTSTPTQQLLSRVPALPTIVPRVDAPTPEPYPTLDRSAALPTPVLPSGSGLSTSMYAVITAENIQQIELVAALRSDDGINSNLAFSPDGRTLAAGSSTGLIHVWDTETRVEIATLDGHTARVRALEFSPDGSMLASGSWDKAVILWDTNDWTPVQTLLGHENYVGAVAFSPDGRLLASGGIPLIVWDVASGEQQFTIHASGLIPEDLEFSPDGSLLASAHGETDFFLWNTSNGQLVHTLVGESTTSFLAFSAEGMMAASSSSFSAGDRNPLGQILFWDPWTGTRLGATQENAATIEMIFTVDSSMLITCGWAGHDIFFWQMSDGSRLGRLTGHPRPPHTIALTREGNLLASGDVDGRILLWAVPAGL